MKVRSTHLIDQLFRTEYGKILSILTKYFGASHLQLAEDVVQETLMQAIESWPKSGTPDNPTGWLVQVAKRTAINEIKRNKNIDHQEESFWTLIMRRQMKSF